MYKYHANTVIPISKGSDYVDLCVCSQCGYVCTPHALDLLCVCVCVCSILCSVYKQCAFYDP